MWDEKAKVQLVRPLKEESKVIDMRTWVKEKREAAKNVLIFTRQRVNGPNNDHPPSVA